MFNAVDHVLARLDARLAPGARGSDDWRVAWVLLLPGLSVLAVFGIGPLLFAGYLSLFGGKWGRGPFVGLGNYADAVANPDFWNSVRVTVYYTLGTVPPSLVLSFLIAYALHRIVFARGLLRTLYFLPHITSAVAAAMVWRALLNPRGGAVNAALGLAGLPEQRWLIEPRGVLHLLSGGAMPADWGPSLALVCVMLFDIWHNLGFMVVVFLAALSAIPQELDESARIDGASHPQLLRHIVLPLTAPTGFFLAVVGMLRAFQAFNSFYALTGNGTGPLGTTENLVVHVYDAFYVAHRWGYGAAVSVLLCATLALFTALQWYAGGRRMHQP